MKVGDLVRPRYPSAGLAVRLGVPLSQGICGIVVEHFYNEGGGAIKVMFGGGKVIPFSVQGLVLVNSGAEL